MAKFVLDDVVSGYNLSLINNNFQEIENELNTKVLYRDSPTGEPNQMEVDLDLNNHKLLNVKNADADADGINLGQVKELMESITVGGGSIISDAPPSVAVNGQRWTRCSDMVSFIWYEDIDGGQWVEDNPSMGGTSFLDIPTFVDEAAATLGGLLTNQAYKTPTGELRIKL